MFCFHAWDKWSKVFFRPHVNGGGEDYQRRVCLKCGKVQERIL